MSKSSKARKRKVSATTPKVVETPPADSKKLFQLFEEIKPYLFPVFLAALFILFIVEFGKNPDFQITMIQMKKWFKPTQYFLFSLLTLGFGYFGFRYQQNAQLMNRWDRSVFIGISIIVLAIYVTSFSNEISLNGDNAEYMIITKSIVERGKILRLDMPSETPNSLASFGLPLLLTPIYKFWGFDIVKMKALITLIGFSIFFLLYRLFLHKYGFALATMLALVGVTSPYVVGNARDVMTETPFLFWSVIALILIMKYHESKNFNMKYYLMVFGAIIMTYLTRAVGVGIVAALVIFLISNISWSKIYSKESRQELFRSVDFKKLIFIMLPLILGGILWQILQHSKGISQAGILFNANLPRQIEDNTQSALGVLPQMLFRTETFRFQNFYSTAKLIPLDFTYTVILIVLLIGIITGLRQRNLMANFTLFTALVILVASVTPQQMVIIRYFTVLIPFLIYFFFHGFVTILRYVFRKVRIAEKGSWAIRLLASLALAQILFVNMHGHSVNMTLSTVGNGPGYQDFVDVARWSKNNLPEDAYVVSVKPRLFYVLSGKKGTRLSTIQEEYSKDFEEEKLSLFKRLGITHVVLDGISGATRENIFPIVQNHPDMFQTLYIGQMSGTSSVSKIIYQNQ